MPRGGELRETANEMGISPAMLKRLRSLGTERATQEELIEFRQRLVLTGATRRAGTTQTFQEYYPVWDAVLWAWGTVNKDIQLLELVGSKAEEYIRRLGVMSRTQRGGFSAYYVPTVALVAAGFDYLRDHQLTSPELEEVGNAILDKYVPEGSGGSVPGLVETPDPFNYEVRGILS